MSNGTDFQFMTHQSRAVANIDMLIEILSHDPSQKTTILYLKDARTQLTIAEKRYAFNKHTKQ